MDIPTKAKHIFFYVYLSIPMGQFFSKKQNQWGNYFFTSLWNFS